MYKNIKNTISFILLLGASNTFADDQALNDARMAWSKAYLAKQGSPVPDGGIKIIPERQMSEYKTFKDQRMQYKKDIAKYGYINKEEPKTNDLFNLHATAAQQYKKYDMNYKPSSSHLRHTIDELKMAYTFVGVPKNDMSEFIGVAPYLTYLKGQGWVGAMQFFVNDAIGNCVFSENNVRLSHGSIIIAKEDAREDVNGKTTTVEVTGTQSSGFLYNVEWFDTTFFRKVECANKEFSEKNTQSVIELAKRIDKN